MKEHDAIIKSPVGYIGIDAEGDAITGISLNIEAGREHIPRAGLAAETAHALKHYFDCGEWPEGIPLKEKGTMFQKRVWKQLRSIRPGEALTYGEVAQQLGSGPRAVGQACRANPCPLLTPCHRVVAASGTGGFSGAVDGNWPRIKSWLLRHEGYFA